MQFLGKSRLFFMIFFLFKVSLLCEFKRLNSFIEELLALVQTQPSTQGL